MLPSPNDINNFIEVSKTENLSRAAERLGITQPSISLSMKRLEDNFGLALLIRSKSGVKLTRAGRKFLTGAKVIVEDWEKLKAETIKTQMEVSGEVSIGCHPSVALYSLSKFLPQLLNKHQSLNIVLKHNLSRRLAEDVISLRLDLSFVVNPVSHPDLVIHKLCTDKVGFWHAKSILKSKSAGKNNPALNQLIYDPSLTQSETLLKKM